MASLKSVAGHIQHLLTLKNIIDVFDPQFKMWYIGQITGFAENDQCSIIGVRVHFYGYRAKYDETIPLTDVYRFAPLHTHTIKLILLKNPPYFHCKGLPPIYYHNYYKQKDYIIMTPCRYGTDTDAILKYNINTNEYSELMPFNTIISDNTKSSRSGRTVGEITHSAHHSHIINKSNNYLIVYGGEHNMHLSIDVDAQRQISAHASIHRPSYHYPSRIYASVYVSDPINELHAFGRLASTAQSYNPENEGHFRYDENRKVFSKLSSEFKYFARNVKPEFGIGEYSKVVYIEKQQRLVVFGGSIVGRYKEFNRKIFCSHVDSPGQKTFIWNEMNCWLPRTSPHYEIILAFNTMIFLVYFKETHLKEMYCMDLMDNNLDCSWIKCDKPFPTNHCYAILTKDGYVHFINSYNEETFHCKLSLYEIIPQDIFKKYKSQQYVLVCGYVKGIDMSRVDGMNVFSQIPPEITNIILAYTPLF